MRTLGRILLVVLVVLAVVVVWFVWVQPTIQQARQANAEMDVMASAKAAAEASVRTAREAVAVAEAKVKELTDNPITVTKVVTVTKEVPVEVTKVVTVTEPCETVGSTEPAAASPEETVIAKIPPCPTDVEAFYASITVTKNADGSCTAVPAYPWWIQDRAWNSGERDPILTFEVPADQVGILWGTTAAVDGTDVSGTQVTRVGSGQHKMTGWSWGTILRGWDRCGFYEKYQAVLNGCAFGGTWTSRSQ